MVDLFGKDKGNISLPAKLQSWDDEKERSKPTIINTQRTFYNIKIEDIEHRINRLEDRNDELLEEIEITNERLVITDAETADEISNLSKQLYSQSDKVHDLRAKIDNVENNRTKDKRSHDDKVELFDQRYKKKKVELVSQIKVLTAKINGLEDFKKTQNGLEAKFERNEKQMTQNEEEMKELLESVHRKFEFDKEMLKNEMYVCLLDLAARFQVGTDQHTSLPNKRLMRENVMLKNELSQISRQLSSENNIRSSLTNSIVDHRRYIVKKFSHTRENIISIRVQDAVLKCFKNKFINTKEHFSSINVPDLAMESKYLMLIDNARRDEHIRNVRLSKLHVSLDKERKRIDVARYLHRKLSCKIKAVVETLYDLKYIVRCFLEGPINYPNIASLNCIQMLMFLRNLFIKGQFKVRCGITKSIETLPQELHFPTTFKEDLNDISDFEISTESQREEEIFDKVKLSISSDKRKEISIESSGELKEEPPSEEDISQDVVPFDFNDDYKLSENQEYMEDESVLSIEE